MRGHTRRWREWWLQRAVSDGARPRASEIAPQRRAKLAFACAHSAQCNVQRASELHWARSALALDNVAACVVAPLYPRMLRETQRGLLGERRSIQWTYCAKCDVRRGSAHVFFC